MEDDKAYEELRHLGSWSSYYRITNAGITSRKQLLEINSEKLSKLADVPITKINAMKEKAKVIINKKIVQKVPFNLSDDFIYFDVETDLDLSFIWLIGVCVNDRIFSLYLDYGSNVKKEKLEKENLSEFLNILEKNPSKPLCYFSAKGFDKNMIIKRCLHHNLNIEKFMLRDFIDLSGEITSRFIFPCKSNGLKDISQFLGFKPKTDIESGIVAACMYLENKKKNKKQLIEYNADDLLSMKFVIKKLTGPNFNHESEFIHGFDVSKPIPENKYKELRDSGLKLREICEITSKKLTYVYSRINKNYAPSHSDKNKYNLDFYNKDLKEQVIEIKKLRDDGLTLSEIANSLGANISYIYKRLKFTEEEVDMKDLERTKFYIRDIEFQFRNIYSYVDETKLLKNVLQKLNNPLEEYLKNKKPIKEYNKYLQKSANLIYVALSDNTYKQNNKFLLGRLFVDKQTKETIIAIYVKQLQILMEEKTGKAVTPYGELFKTLVHEIFHIFFNTEGNVRKKTDDFIQNKLRIKN